jgi:radical SAM enzyme (TIGR01210 family)
MASKHREVKNLVVESLPRFLELNKVQQIAEAIGPQTKLIIGIGLQSINERIRRIILGTPIKNSEIECLSYLRMIENICFRIYLLFGKPILNTKEDIEDIKSSINILRKYLKPEDSITINRMIVGEETPIDYLQKLKLYIAPNLCTLRRLIEDCKKEYKDLDIRPGAIDVKTCVKEIVSNSKSCQSCYNWLVNEEIEKDNPNFRCEDKNYLDVGLPWNLLGSFERRCSYVKNNLKSYI